MLPTPMPFLNLNLPTCFMAYLAPPTCRMWNVLFDAAGSDY